MLTRTAVSEILPPPPIFGTSQSLTPRFGRKATEVGLFIFLIGWLSGIMSLILRWVGEHVTGIGYTSISTFIFNGMTIYFWAFIVSFLIGVVLIAIGATELGIPHTIFVILSIILFMLWILVIPVLFVTMILLLFVPSHSVYVVVATMWLIWGGILGVPETLLIWNLESRIGKIVLITAFICSISFGAYPILLDIFIPVIWMKISYYLGLFSYFPFFNSLPLLLFFLSYYIAWKNIKGKKLKVQPEIVSVSTFIPLLIMFLAITVLVLIIYSYGLYLPSPP